MNSHSRVHTRAQFVALLVSVMLGCAPAPPPGVTETGAAEVYRVLSTLSLEEYLDSLYVQVPLRVMGTRTDVDPVPLTEVWPVFTYAFATTDLNVRSTPDLSANVLTVIPSGGRVRLNLRTISRPGIGIRPPDLIRALFYRADPNWEFTSQEWIEAARQEFWVRIQFQDVSGWASTRFLAVPPRSEFLENRGAALLTSADVTLEGERADSFDRWLFLGFPAGILVNLCLFFLLGNRALHFGRNGYSIRWRTFHAITFPPHFYVIALLWDGQLLVSEVSGALLMSAGIVAVLSVPGALVASLLIDQCGFRPLSWSVAEL